MPAKIIIIRLSRHLQVPIEAAHVNEEHAQVAEDILSNPTYHGKAVPICWDPRNIPPMTESFWSLFRKGSAAVGTYGWEVVAEPKAWAPAS